MMTDKAICDNALEVIKHEAAALASCEAVVNEEFTTVVKLIAACSGRVVVIGIGKTGIIGRKIAASLASTGTLALFVHATEALHGDLGMIADGDIALALSFSGESDELNKVLPVLQRRGVKIVAMTGRAESKLAQQADHSIVLPPIHEACPFNLAPTASTTAMLGVGDALAITLMKMKGFSEADYALSHPGGMLGKLLMYNVSDIMHSGERNPVVALDASVKDALLVMTSAKSGATSVVNPDGTLAGFFTDGDLRRKLQNDSQLLDKKIAEVMTLHPTVLKESMKAADAAKILSDKRIDNAPVVDCDGRVTGIVDEGDLLPFLSA